MADPSKGKGKGVDIELGLSEDEAEATAEARARAEREEIFQQYKSSSSSSSSEDDTDDPDDVSESEELSAAFEAAKNSDKYDRTPEKEFGHRTKSKAKTLYRKGLTRLSKTGIMKRVTRHMGREMGRSLERMPSLSISGPRWVLALLASAVLLSYLDNPVYRDWRWWTLILVSCLSILVILWSWYKRFVHGELLSLGVIMDLFWIFIFINVLRLFVAPFRDSTRLRSDAILSVFRVFMWILVIVYALLVILYAMCFVESTTFLAVRLVYYASFIL